MSAEQGPRRFSGGDATRESRQDAQPQLQNPHIGFADRSSGAPIVRNEHEFLGDRRLTTQEPAGSGCLGPVRDVSY